MEQKTLVKSEKAIEVSAGAKIEPVSEPITLDPAYLYQAQSWEDFVSLWMVSKEIDIKNQWFKGDIANRLTVVYGEESIRKFAQEVKEKTITIEQYRRVSRAFPPGRRGLTISWTHYFIASYTDSYNRSKNKFIGRNRFNWADKANDEGWSTIQLAQEIKKANALTDKLSLFQYYNNYLSKVQNILLHIEKDKLHQEELKNLLERLRQVFSAFETYVQE